ncbi:hypothetical protein PAPYR_5750 [Paratrimastix pyriformis]|uniref:Uncharacterized protein n=1 Tax=Paratrimastix pyriformis TaxID=342808 RepID=A0ABQ8UPA1_9EUKA|nr:hypothetical protein PAPYR_5750 [Paratrimastix pyriformis]
MAVPLPFPVQLQYHRLEVLVNSLQTELRRAQQEIITMRSEMDLLLREREVRFERSSERHSPPSLRKSPPQNNKIQELHHATRARTNSVPSIPLGRILQQVGIQPPSNLIPPKVVRPMVNSISVPPPPPPAAATTKMPGAATASDQGSPLGSPESDRSSLASDQPGTPPIPESTSPAPLIHLLLQDPTASPAHSKSPLPTGVGSSSTSPGMLRPVIGSSSPGMPHHGVGLSTSPGMSHPGFGSPITRPIAAPGPGFMAPPGSPMRGSLPPVAVSSPTRLSPGMHRPVLSPLEAMSPSIMADAGRSAPASTGTAAPAGVIATSPTVGGPLNSSLLLNSSMVTVTCQQQQQHNSSLGSLLFEDVSLVEGEHLCPVPSRQPR